MTLLVRIDAEIGGLKLSKIEPLHIIRLMNTLAEGGARADDKYILKDEYIPLLKENKKLLCEIMNERTVANISKRRATNEKTANKIADALEIKVLTMFDAENSKDKLSQQTLLHHYKLLSSIFNKAIKWRYITINPVKGADDYCPRVERQEKEFLNVAEIGELLKLVESEALKYQTAVYIAVLGGLRLGDAYVKHTLKFFEVFFLKRNRQMAHNRQLVPLSHQYN